MPKNARFPFGPRLASLELDALQSVVKAIFSPDAVRWVSLCTGVGNRGRPR